MPGATRRPRRYSGAPQRGADALRAEQPLRQVALQLVERDALLRHRVALPHGHGLVLERVEVHRDAERRADLVVATVATADRTGVVEVDVPVPAQVVGEPAGHRRELLVPGQRQDGGLDRRQAGVEPEDRALVDAALRVRGLVLVVGVEQEGHERTREPEGRLDDVRHVLLVRGLVEEPEVLAGRLDVVVQVEVGAVRDAHELAPLRALEAEAVLDVGGRVGVVGPLAVRHVEAAEVLRVDAEVGEERDRVGDPLLVVLPHRRRRHEVLDLHLFELARAEDEVAGRDLVAERLAHLADAERRLHATGGDDLREVDEDALRGLGAEEVQPLLRLDRAEVGLEHAGELPGLGPLAAGAAVRAGDLGHAALGRTALLRLERLDEVVLAEPVVAVQALDERVGEGRDVPGGLPHLAGQDDGGVEADHVAAAADEPLPPLALDVLLELHAEGPVVPRRARSAVDLPRLEDEAAALGQGDDAVETGGRCQEGLLWSPDWVPGAGTVPGKRTGPTAASGREARHRWTRASPHRSEAVHRPQHVRDARDVVLVVPQVEGEPQAAGPPARGHARGAERGERRTVRVREGRDRLPARCRTERGGEPVGETGGVPPGRGAVHGREVPQGGDRAGPGRPRRGDVEPPCVGGQPHVRAVAGRPDVLAGVPTGLHGAELRERPVRERGEGHPARSAEPLVRVRDRDVERGGRHRQHTRRLGEVAQRQGADRPRRGEHRRRVDDHPGRGLHRRPRDQRGPRADGVGEALERDAPHRHPAVRLREEREHDRAEVAVGDDDLGAVRQRRGDDRDHRRRLRPGGDPGRSDAHDVGEERAALLDQGAVRRRRGPGTCPRLEVRALCGQRAVRGESGGARREVARAVDEGVHALQARRPVGITPGQVPSRAHNIVLWRRSTRSCSGSCSPYATRGPSVVPPRHWATANPPSASSSSGPSSDWGTTWSCGAVVARPLPSPGACSPTTRCTWRPPWPPPGRTWTPSAGSPVVGCASPGSRARPRPSSRPCSPRWRRRVPGSRPRTSRPNRPRRSNWSAAARSTSR
ncbi:putative transcriptional regulator [Curtobacterium sp. ER1/6]|nr:putative transcriptional regulator [Curtobacterium sp. ER1/6]